MWFEKCLDALPTAKRLKGRPRRRPAKLHADKWYDYKRCRDYLKRRGIASRIARKGIESSERLGKHRWVVERPHGWFAGSGKLRIRFERQLQTHQALLLLAAAIICSWFFAQRSCSRLLIRLDASRSETSRQTWPPPRTRASKISEKTYILRVGRDSCKKPQKQA